LKKRKINSQFKIQFKKKKIQFKKLLLLLFMKTLSKELSKRCEVWKKFGKSTNFITKPLS